MATRETAAVFGQSAHQAVRKGLAAAVEQAGRPPLRAAFADVVGHAATGRG